MPVDPRALGLRLANLMNAQASPGWKTYSDQTSACVVLDGLFDLEDVARRLLQSFRVEARTDVQP